MYNKELFLINKLSKVKKESWLWKSISQTFYPLLHFLEREWPRFRYTIHRHWIHYNIVNKFLMTVRNIVVPVGICHRNINWEFTGICGGMYLGGFSRGKTRQWEWDTGIDDFKLPASSWWTVRIKDFWWNFRSMQLYRFEIQLTAFYSDYRIKLRLRKVVVILAYMYCKIIVYFNV